MPEPYLSEAHRHMLEVESSIGESAIRQRGYYTCTDPAELVALGFSDAQAIVPTLVIPIWSIDGDVVSYQHRPDDPRIKDGKPLKYESLPGKPPRLDIHPCARTLVGNPNIPAWIGEGVKTGDSGAVRGLAVITLPGVWSWRGKNVLGGITELADWEGIAIKGRVLYIAFDNDCMLKPEVRLALRRLAKFLRRRGAKDVLPVVIPSMVDGAKTGMDDYFAAGGELSKLYESVNRELLAQEGIITNNRALHDVGDEALAFVLEANEPPSVFVRAGELARVIEDERGIPKIEGFSESSLRSTLSRCATFLKVLKKDASEIYPPREVVQDILTRGMWNDLPPIISVTRAPVLSPNAKLNVHPGYCPDSHFFIAAKSSWPEWSGTTEEAVDFLLRDMLCDFPFADDASAAHALALMLLPIVRPIIDGPTPLHLFGAHVPGSGKSKLATVCLMPTCGNYIATTAAGRDEEEWRKKISSALLEGRPYIFLDNLSKKLDSDSLAKGLTDMEWNDRMISTFRNINVPVRCAWVATANNVELSRDILRRTLWCHIDPNLENPEERDKFRHDPITAWVSQNRPRIVSALCKLIQAWLDAGRPEFNRARIGSYEEWSKAIGGILEVAGVPGFLANINELRQAANSDEQAWADFYQRWWEKFYGIPVKPAMLLEMFMDDDELAGMILSKEDGGKRAQLGHRLKKRVGIVCGGMRIERLDTKTDGSNSYRLTRTAEMKGGLGLSNGVSGYANGVLNGVCDQVKTSNSGSKTEIIDEANGVKGVSDFPHAHTGAHAHAHVSRAGETPLNPIPGSSNSKNPPENPLLTGRVSI